VNGHATGEPVIELDRFLKAMQLVDSGGEAKHLVRSGAVRVNGEDETRRGRKLRTGDEVEVEDPEDGGLRRFRVEVGGDPPGRETGDEPGSRT